MADILSTGPAKLVLSVLNMGVGLVKQVAGIVLNRDSLEEEGKAQQDKASAEKDVAKKEAAAEKARVEAKAQESREKAAKGV